MARGLSVVGRTLGATMSASLRQELPHGTNFAQRALPLMQGTSSARYFMSQHFDSPLSRGFAGNVNLAVTDSPGVRSYSTKLEDDSHDDFKPVSNVKASQDVTAYIDQCLKEHKVFIFMKGTPDAPQCGFSNMACQVLKTYGVAFGAANVLEDPELRETIKEYSKWPTIPQVYVDNEFLGGSDILMSMHQSGELAEALGVEKKE
eukprot:CAMPEP_0118933138 /NCGR_PEP_ID=MMETSP1169-20130426/11394_1 /TAXON_ID=36882 /ORGANISM="Pyramimonas obovata, Strain CCMP722" /LENGTH=203 /DNA_ID=CAMNT_0006875865 /DNA_START=88 /DNA_END=699 /DNA_ORIENTATION=+